MSAESGEEFTNMEWTTDLPTESGWYWFEGQYTGPDIEACILPVKAFNGRVVYYNPNKFLRKDHRWCPIEQLKGKGKWAGPIPAPKD